MGLTRESWLNGWPRYGSETVLIGTGLHCVGCGKTLGITTVVFEEGYVPPPELPAWPFDPETCPVCSEPTPKERPKTYPHTCHDFTKQPGTCYACNLERMKRRQP